MSVVNQKRTNRGEREISSGLPVGNEIKSPAPLQMEGQREGKVDPFRFSMKIIAKAQMLGGANNRRANNGAVNRLKFNFTVDSH